jgi:hypothetical protein
MVGFIAKTYGIEHLFGFQADWIHRDTHKPLTIRALADCRTIAERHWQNSH